MSARRQLQALLRLRWQMIRTPRGRAAVLLVPVIVVASVVMLLAGVERLALSYTTEALLLLPTALLAFLIFAPAAAIAAGGGNEIVPAEQLVSYPVSARMQFFGSLLLAPLNIAWLLQVIGLLVMVAYVAGDVRAPALIGTGVFIVLSTTVGQAVAWGVMGVRQRRGGRILAWAALGLIIALTLAVVISSRLTEVLDRSPLLHVVIGSLRPFDTRWWITTLVMVAGIVLAAEAGARVCAWALYRPGDTGVHRDALPLPRRPAPRSVLAGLVAIDRASVWRSTPLRRGALILGLLPGIAAAAAGLTWHNLVIIPGLVAAGAGLLFGVNAFSLDGPGALWVASQPNRPSLILAAKLWVIAEVCIVAVLLAVLGGAVRASGDATWTAIAALAAMCTVSVVGVVAVCLRLSVTRPHRAVLRGPRDTPAPPGTMAGYSLRLAARSTLVGILFVLTSYGSNPALPLLLAMPFLLLSARNLAGTFRLWANAAGRSAVITTVAHG